MLFVTEECIVEIETQSVYKSHVVRDVSAQSEVFLFSLHSLAAITSANELSDLFDTCN